MALIRGTRSGPYPQNHPTKVARNPRTIVDAGWRRWRSPRLLSLSERRLSGDGPIGSSQRGWSGISEAFGPDDEPPSPMPSVPSRRALALISALRSVGAVPTCLAGNDRPEQSARGGSLGVVLGEPRTLKWVNSPVKQRVSRGKSTSEADVPILSLTRGITFHAVARARRPSPRHGRS